MEEKFFSVRMRASLEGKHISGQERIVTKSRLEETILELHKRPSDKWDFQSIKIELLNEKPKILEKSLQVKSYKFSCVPLAHSFIAGLLESEHGINNSLTRKLISKLLSGVNKGWNLVGAWIIEPTTGEVLNPQPLKGIRTILFDWVDREKVKKLLLEKGYTLRTLDALALATKNVYCGVEAEICISDDPNYTTGYIAAKKLGYIRITPIKEKGNPFGGRVYFVRRENLEKTLECLRKKPLLIREPNI